MHALLAWGLTSYVALELDRATVAALFETDPGSLPAASAAASQVRRGEMLFRDGALSRDGTRSCANCHELGEGRFDAGREPREVVVGDGSSRFHDVPALYDAGRQLV